MHDGIASTGPPADAWQPVEPLAMTLQQAIVVRAAVLARALLD